MKKILKSIFYLFFPLLIGGIVGFLISGSIDYNVLEKPPLAPPSIVFPIAWSIIYLLMGISYYLYKKKEPTQNEVDFIYYIQLFVNALWSIIFFLWKWRFFSILWILLLLFLVVILIKAFKPYHKVSSWLNLPYLLWVIFATYLTIGIYLLN